MNKLEDSLRPVFTPHLAHEIIGGKQGPARTKFILTLYSCFTDPQIPFEDFKTNKINDDIWCARRLCPFRIDPVNFSIVPKADRDTITFLLMANKYHTEFTKLDRYLLEKIGGFLC